MPPAAGCLLLQMIALKDVSSVEAAIVYALEPVLVRLSFSLPTSAGGLLAAARFRVPWARAARALLNSSSSFFLE